MAWLKHNTAPDGEPSEAKNETEAAEDAKTSDAASEVTPADKPETADAPGDPEVATRINAVATRRRRGLAVLGLVVLLFAVVGLVSTIVGGIRLIKSARDTSYLKEDMYYTLLPLMQYAPVAFDNPDDSKQDALIQAALYEITNREWIREQQDSNYVSPYPVDDYGRTAIPIADVTAAYNDLFGADTIPYCHTFGDDAGPYFTYQYDEANQLYYVPYSEVFSAYQPAIDTIQRAGRMYKVRVGYVHSQDITVDDHGNSVVDVNRATYYQIYTVERLENDHFVIRSVADESTSKPTAKAAS